jgi:hypothetical protein
VRVWAIPAFKTGAVELDTPSFNTGQEAPF